MGLKRSLLFMLAIDIIGFNVNRSELGSSIFEVLSQTEKSNFTDWKDFYAMISFDYFTKYLHNICKERTTPVVNT